VKRALPVSLVLHALAIMLLLTIRTPEPPRARFAHVSPIASPYRAPAPAKSAQHVQPLRPLRTAARTFHVPDRLPQPAPGERTSVLPDPPSVHAALILVPAPTLEIADIPPPVRRVVVATGAFDAAIPSNRASAHTEITTGTFGNASIASAGTRLSQNAPRAIFSAAEILVKPRPGYTDEARRLRIEGEVLLEVLFGASGEVRVIRMIRGLGHGLDENALSAARAIHFRPAQSGDAAVDSTAVVHIVFQLAY
jgi:TonB family protein